MSTYFSFLSLAEASKFEYDTANARLRIVSERVDIIDNLIISVTVTSDIVMYMMNPYPLIISSSSINL